jgi:hypothetical protein
MRNMFFVQKTTDACDTTRNTPALGPPGPRNNSPEEDTSHSVTMKSIAASQFLFAGYLSDMSSEGSDYGSEDADDEDEGKEDEHGDVGCVQVGSTGNGVSQSKKTPPLKRRRLVIPRRITRNKTHEKKDADFRTALAALDKLLISKKNRFDNGQRGLQARCTLAIRSHLLLVVKGRLGFAAASMQAAASNGFAAAWGGRMLRTWTRAWMKSKELPTSMQGKHAKVYSLLSDPAIATEMRVYLRSNKWAMNPEKLSQFTKNELAPNAASDYLRHITEQEMPRGLKRFMEVELFPRIHLKVGRGVSLSTARRWLHREGFRYIGHKKGLYFDGHDRPDVVSYRQDEFLPKMKLYESRFVRYVVGDVSKELHSDPPNFVETRKVLLAHDEMTAQANDARGKSWVFDDQHTLRKKGVGRGLHQSDVICSTMGFLPGASQTIEYGKNYDGYWTGEMFVNQVCSS